MKKLISTSAIGIGCGFSILVIFLLTAILINPDFFADINQAEFIRYVVCSAITGLGFSIPSMIYEKESISRGLQVIIHLGTGFLIYIPTAFFAGWIPTAYGFIAVAISFMIALVFALSIWFCFWIYFRKEAVLMNEKIAEKSEQ